MISLATINNTISSYNSYLNNNKGNTGWSKISTAGKLHSIIAPYRVLREMLRITEAVHPPHTCLYYCGVYMRLLGLWPAQRAVEHPLYYAYNMLIMTLFSFFVTTIICDLYEASADFVVLGEDLVVALGLVLILFKMLLFRAGKSKTESIIRKFDLIYAKYANISSNTELSRRIRQCQRNFFVHDVFITTAFIILSLLLFAAMSLQPLFSQQALPFRSKFPFAWDNPDEHLIAFVCIYAFQCFCVLYMLVCIVVMDGLGGNCFNQTTLNLRILCEIIRNLPSTGDGNGDFSTEIIIWQELREAVKFHQIIIELIDTINHTFYWNYVSQMGASTFMICLTAFEALLAHDQPMVALKFQTYMFSALMQLFYWCFMGNRTYYDSMEVARAAFEVNCWYERSPRLQRNLMFIIKRAQKPLVFRAKPFFGFTFESFASILSTSYSYFALLRTVSD
ncbi:odorant receptor 47b [Eurosta solidaginis]|uniref:odorant receptor 47b n=1 Tax=Eurosta solidaginis TaxID=178769 RepID=UPI003531236A